MFWHNLFVSVLCITAWELGKAFGRWNDSKKLNCWSCPECTIKFKTDSKEWLNEAVADHQLLHRVKDTE